MQSLLRLKDLRVRFSSRDQEVYAVNGISFDLFPGERVGIAGESGSGKSVTCKAMLRLLPSDAELSGHAVLTSPEELNLLAADDQELQSIRGGRIGYAYQDARSALDPHMPIGAQLALVASVHGADDDEALDLAHSWLKRVGITDAERRFGAYPHEFSGGMCQRVGIAMALIASPDLLIADEPTSDVDVTTQKLLVELLQHLCEEQGLSLILVSHDLGVISKLCDSVLILYGGLVVESGPVEQILTGPVHPYTQGLLNSIPKLGPARTIPAGIAGQPLTNLTPLARCPFYDRCELREDRCALEVPQLAPSRAPLSGASPRPHLVRCPVALGGWS
jgi:oligopeptide/dipeptide ABC transporter ATP-binding protein